MTARDDHDDPPIEMPTCEHCGGLDRRAVAAPVWCSCKAKTATNPQPRPRTAYDETEYFLIIDEKPDRGASKRKIHGPADRARIQQIRDDTLRKLEQRAPRLRFTYHIAKLVYHEERTPGREPRANPRMRPDAEPD